MKRRSPAARDIYFPLETAPREYSGHLLLGVALALRGFTATIGFKGSVVRAMKSATSPGVAFYKHEQRFSPLVARSVGQDPETGILQKNFEDFFARRKGLQTAENADAYFCYGRDDYDFLSEALPDANICLTGSPRVMLWGEAGKQFYADQIEQIRSRYGHFVLLASSGVRGNPHRAQLEKSGVLGPERHRVERDDAVAQEMLRAAQQISHELQRMVVVRPHPGEDLALWRSAALGEPLIAVETCFDLIAWIHAADVVIHRNSTAGIESVIAGVPTITYAESELSLERDRVATYTSVSGEVSRRVVGKGALCEEIDSIARSGTAMQQSGWADTILKSKIHRPLRLAPGLICDEIERLGPWSSAYGLDCHLPRDLAVRFESRWRDDERIGVSEKPLGPKRRPLLPSRVGRDVHKALQVLESEKSVRVRFRERDCFTLLPHK